MLGIKKTIPYKYLNKFNLKGIREHITEAQTIEIPTTNGQKIRISNVYVPPHNSVANRGGESSRNEGGVSRGGRSGGRETTRGTSKGVNRGGNSIRRRSNRIAVGRNSGTASGRAGRGGLCTGGRNTRNRDTARNENGQNNRRSNNNEGREGENTKVNDQYFNLSRWPKQDYDLICGDINAHPALWDDAWASRRADARGKTVEDWMANNNMMSINEGSPTHDSRSSETGSAPDITIAHTSMMSKLTWETKK